jgi:hypothetical protein
VYVIVASMMDKSEFLEEKLGKDKEKTGTLLL